MDYYSILFASKVSGGGGGGSVDHVAKISGYGVQPRSGNSNDNIDIVQQNARAFVALDTGEHPYPYRANTYILTKNYYPIPIPVGASTFTITMPDTLYYGLRIAWWTGSQYNSYSSSWTAPTITNWDVSAYNDGTYFIVLTFKKGTAGTGVIRDYEIEAVSYFFQ